MPVVLVVDEYHLDIRADGELVSRYYLADVEVARDIAERFIIFLGEDEMEFLADDALQFAYDGVAAMQAAWLAAQKRKRKHKKAAEQSARRKEEEVHEAAAAPQQRLQADASERIQRTRPAAARSPDAPPSELAKRIAAATQAEKAARQAMIKAEPLPEAKAITEPLPAEILPEPMEVSESENMPVFDQATPGVGANEPSIEVVAASNGFHADVVELDQVDELPVEILSHPNEEEMDLAPEPPVPTGPVVIPTVTFTSERLDQGATTPKDEGVRFALAGHHPAETNVGLLSRFRRQPKVPDNHTHKFLESGSGVGLVRRVCTECSYVSIGSGD